MGNLPKGITRKQKILHAIATGDTSDLPEGITRKEKILHAIASGDTSNIPEGITREEQILQYIAENGGVSGGDETEWSLKPFLDFTKSTAYMFYYNQTLENVPADILKKTDTSNVTKMGRMFHGCSALTTIPELDTSNVTDMNGMFYGCSALTTIPELDTSNVTDMSWMFSGFSLTTIPELDTSNVTDMNSMFSNCSALTTVPELDIRKVTYTYNVFENCAALETCLIKNIQCDGIDLSYSPLLTLDSLIHLIKELRNTGSSKTLTLGSTNLAKLSDTYVKLVTITDEMRAEDDLIDEKLPFEVCESTDDGAMLITSYVTKKKWTLS